MGSAEPVSIVWHQITGIWRWRRRVPERDGQPGIARDFQKVFDPRPERGRRTEPVALEKSMRDKGTRDSVSLDAFEQPVQKRLVRMRVARKPGGAAQEDAVSGGRRIGVAGVDELQRDWLQSAGGDIEGHDPWQRHMPPSPPSVRNYKFFEQIFVDAEVVCSGNEHAIRRNQLGEEAFEQLHDCADGSFSFCETTPQRRHLGKRGRTDGLNHRQPDPVEPGQVAQPRDPASAAKRQQPAEKLIQAVRRRSELGGARFQPRQARRAISSGAPSIFDAARSNLNGKTETRSPSAWPFPAGLLRPVAWRASTQSASPRQSDPDRPLPARADQRDAGGVRRASRHGRFLRLRRLPPSRHQAPHPPRLQAQGSSPACRDRSEDRPRIQAASAWQARCRTAHARRQDRLAAPWPIRRTAATIPQEFHLVSVREIPHPFGNVGEAIKVLAIEGGHGLGVERMRLACGVPYAVDEADHFGECRIRCLGLAGQPE